METAPSPCGFRGLDPIQAFTHQDGCKRCAEVAALVPLTPVQRITGPNLALFTSRNAEKRKAVS